MTPPDHPTDDQTIEMAEMFRLMGDATRLRIIFECLKGPVCVGDMADRLQASQSLISHHLRLLRAARILKSERQGKQVFYSAADEHISCVLTDMAHHVGEPVSEFEV
ncbi:MAG: metalloregulator ArsR/SmtB family transcription factor [Alphaproteobacteria bacterium]